MQNHKEFFIQLLLLFLFHVSVNNIYANIIDVEVFETPHEFVFGLIKLFTISFSLIGYFHFIGNIKEHLNGH